MPANNLIFGAHGKLLDFYDWRLDQDDTGMLQLLHRDLPSASKRQTRENDDEEEAEEDVTSATDTATRSQSTIVVASGYVRAMHTAIVVLGREAHSRSILCPLTSAEWTITQYLDLVFISSTIASTKHDKKKHHR
jgi:hypothetical protein